MGANASKGGGGAPEPLKQQRQQQQASPPLLPPPPPLAFEPPSALPGPLARLARRLLAPASFEDVGDYTPTGRATGVYMLRLPLANVYFADGVLIDSGTRLDFGKIQNALDRLAEISRSPSHRHPHEPAAGGDAASPPPFVVGHAITHAHQDHQGSSARLCRHYGVPFFVGAGDADVAEGSDRMRVGPRFHPFHWLPHGLLAGPPHPVAQRLKQGDRLGKTGAIEVIETPGHTPGSVTYWCPRSRVAIVGDVMSNGALLSLPIPPLPPFLRGGGNGGIDLAGGDGNGASNATPAAGEWRRWSFPPAPRQPMKHLCHSAFQNRRSLDVVWALHPAVIVFGHGPPLVLEEEPAAVALESTAVG